MYRRNYDGLTVGDVIKQSALIHPDWDLAAHRDYLLGETAFESTDLGLNALLNPCRADSVEEQCQYPPGCAHEVIAGHRLCLEHQVALTRLFAPADGHDWLEA